MLLDGAGKVSFDMKTGIVMLNNDTVSIAARVS